jgi:FKBP-type peptidyl-prolyl cis-trans isomerase
MKKLVVLSVCCAALLVSCGGPAGEESTETPAAETSPAPAATPSAPETLPTEPAAAPPETAVQPPAAAPKAMPSQPTGIQTTASGLKYEVIKMGTGRKPTLADRVTVHYRGELTNGQVFDSSYDRGQPATFPLGGVVKGWQEGVQLMPVGSTFRFEIPPDLGYGSRGAGPIPPNSTLIFQVELLSIN